MIDHGDVPMAGGAQRRHSTRRKMFEPVALSFGGVQVRAHFLDLSQSGALVHSETPPGAGSYLTVEAAGLETSGRVMWAKGKRFGIQFSQPLTEGEVEVLIRGT